MSRIKNVGELADALSGADTLLASLKGEQEKSAAAELALATANEQLADVTARLEALQAELVEMKDVASLYEIAKTDLEAQITVQAELNAKITEFEAAIVAKDEELASVKADAESFSESVTNLSTELTSVKAENEDLTAKLAEAIATAEAEHAVAEGAVEQFGIVAEALELKGESADVPNQLESVEEDKGVKLASEYKKLLSGRTPKAKQAARKFYLDNRTAIAAHLDQTYGGTSQAAATVANSESGISEAEWSQYDAWLAERVQLNSRSSVFSTEERNRRAFENRRMYQKNKDLFDRCNAARHSR